MKELKERSVDLGQSCVLFEPVYRKRNRINFGHIYSGAYNIENGILAFKEGDVLFLKPIEKGDVEILHKANYKEMNFRVPCTKCEYPDDVEIYRKWVEIFGSPKIK